MFELCVLVTFGRFNLSNEYLYCYMCPLHNCDPSPTLDTSEIILHFIIMVSVLFVGNKLLIDLLIFPGDN